MERYRARFERNRGHFLVLEGEPAITRAECDEFQIRMLQACEVPGLVSPDVAEIDGIVILRYSLEGARMLSQAMRSAKWSMNDFMGALCRLAEIMEDCRLYLLDAERIRLEDDWMFVGDGWQDLRLVYVPVMSEAPSLADSLERLVVRWIMQVPGLEGDVVQHILRMVLSPDFTPAALRRYARSYMADKLGAGIPAREDERRGTGTAAREPDRLGTGVAAREPDRLAPGMSGKKLDSQASQPQVSQVQVEGSVGHGYPSPYPAAAARAVPQEASTSSSDGWRWFQPSRAEPQHLSGLLGDDLEPFDEEEHDSEDHVSNGAGRRRTLLICAVIGVSAIAWRMGFAGHPGTNGLLFSVGVTLIACAAAIWFWNGQKKDDRRSQIWLPEQRDGHSGSGFATFEEPSPLVNSGNVSASATNPSNPFQQTGVLSSVWRDDLTQQLQDNQEETAQDTFYLEWESGRSPIKIPLQDESVVIGRSTEAAKHVDETHGVSRAHLELVRTQDGWKAKDLGSRNGTRLNETPMVPYEAYTLQPDDCLVLAESHYRFRRSGS